MATMKWLLVVFALSVGCRSQAKLSIPVCASLDVSCSCALAGWVICDSACVNPETDHDNCGSCGNDCGDQVCDKGKCVDSCYGRECGGSCVAADDPRNCGGCGNVCTEGACVAGVCQTKASCEQDYTKMFCDGVCTDPETDANNCGSCGHVCPTGCQYGSCCDGMTCNGSCIDVSYDDYNCGQCNHVCPSGTYCTSGFCQ
jgi:hypothetical protein